MTSSDEERPMNHFFDHDLEYGAMLNRDAWHRGQTDSDLEREAEEMEEYDRAMQYDGTDGWDRDLPDDARDLPSSFPTPLLAEPYRAPLPRSVCESIIDRMEERNRVRQAQRRSIRSPPGVAPKSKVDDPEAEADDEVSDAEPLSPDSLTRERASGPKRQVKSGKKLREERRLTPKRPSPYQKSSSSLK